MNTQIRARRRPRASVLALPLSCFAFLGIVPHAFGLPTAPVVPARDKVTPAISFKTVPFDLAEVRLLGGPFQHAMDLDRDYLLALDVHRLLHNFRVNAGLPSTAQ